MVERGELERYLRVLEVCDEIEACRSDTLRLMSHMSAVDERDGSRFLLSHLREPLDGGEVEVGRDGYTLRSLSGSWRWQRYVAEQVIARRRLIFLKGRQIGVTWIVLAVDVAEALQMPGSTSLVYRQREDEAIDSVRRWWMLYQSLPAYLREGHRVIKPTTAERPGRDGVEIKIGAAISSVVPMSSAASSGHGRSPRHIMLDEAAYIEKLEAIGAAVEPSAGQARISIISTANGRSNPETGDGNEFHRRWIDTGSGYFRLFLPYDVHPDRDEEWYETAPEIRSLKVYQRQAQFPRNANEAFALSDRTFFEVEDLQHYQGQVRVPLYRADFVDDAERTKLARGASARLKRWDDAVATEVKPNRPHGLLRVYEEPAPGTRYAIGADPATGRGLDYSAAYVVNLATMGIAAEFHGRVDEDLFAAQLHYLGRRYGRDVPADPKDPGSQPGFAKLAVENAVGHGAAVIAALRDRVHGRPAYGNLYRHLLDNRADRPEAKPFGFPMNVATRPKVLNQMDQALRERTLPFTTANLQSELEDFIEYDTGTTPRARDGAHDDCVMACAIALEMYRIYGRHEFKVRPKARRGRLIGLGRKAA